MSRPRARRSPLTWAKANLFATRADIVITVGLILVLIWIVPPLASQYLNLTKNSSLAVLIGYPDLVAVFGGTSLNQTGQAIEIIAMLMAFYLAVSLSISAFMNWWNGRTAAWERRT